VLSSVIVFWIEFDVKDKIPEVKREGKTEVVEGKDETKISQGLNSTIPLYPIITNSPVITLPVPEPKPEPKPVPKYASALGVLEKMGFDNEKLNASLLERAKGNVEQVVTWLLQMENSSQH